jgi:glycogen(starch) synthase
MARRVRRLVETGLIQGAGRQPDTLFWRLNPTFRLLFEAAKSYPADIWLANDWTTVLIAQRLAQEQGVAYAYDTHEFAVDEYAHRWRWRLFQRPVVSAVEGKGIGGAAVVSCPSNGIARRLQELYSLQRQPLLIRNMPVYQQHAFRPCGETVEVLYHGVVSPGRALEESIRSVALWRPEFRLTIRGPVSETYHKELLSVAQSSGVSDRVVFAPPVPMVDLVREAAKFDVGLFCLKGNSTQIVYVLPNKFFEYAMSGLALAVSNLPEMAGLVRCYDLGSLVPAVTPEAIAMTINGLKRPDIDRYKRNSLRAAKELNWEIDAERFFAAIDGIVRSPSAGHLLLQDG